MLAYWYEYVKMIFIERIGKKKRMIDSRFVCR